MNNRWMLAIMIALPLAFTGSNCAAKDPGPIVLELFTSEGCSSCPTADTLLSQVVKRDPSSIAGLSEHVDYWNWLGWKDPNSAANFSERQRAYARQLEGSSIYTPQLVVNGVAQDVGNNSQSVEKLIKFGLANRPEALSVSCKAEKDGEVSVVIKTDRIYRKGSTAHIAITEDDIISQVTRGENVGKRLRHDRVVRLFSSSDLKGQSVFCTKCHIQRDWKVQNLKITAFVQEPGPGRIVASGICPLPPLSLAIQDRH